MQPDTQRRIVLLLGSALALAACSGGSSNSASDTPLEITAQLTQYTALDDSLTLQAIHTDGSELLYFTEKDSTGIPSRLTAVRYQTADQAGSDQATWITFPKDSNPVNVVNADGATLTLSISNQIHYQLELVSADGATQLSKQLDLSNLSVNANAVQRDPIPAPSPDTRSKQLSSPAAITPNAHSGNHLAVEVQLSECPDQRPLSGAAVYVSAGAPASATRTPYNAVEISPGRYHAEIPLGNAPLTPAAAQNACDGINTAISVACETTKVYRSQGSAAFCAAVAAGSDTLLAGPSGEGIFIFAACEEAAVALELYCSTVGISYPGHPGPSDPMCAVLADFVAVHPGIQQVIAASELALQAFATAPGRGSQTSEILVRNPFTETVPPLSVDFNGGLRIKQAATLPPVPTQGESYNVSITPACADATIGMELEVVDENGSVFHDSRVLGGDDTVLFSVPGGRDTLQDLVTVRLIDPDLGPIGPLTPTRNLLVQKQPAAVTTSTPIDFALFSYFNFDGEFAPSPLLPLADPADADIQLLGDMENLTLQWSGGALGAAVTDMTATLTSSSATPSVLYCVRAREDESLNEEPFNAPLHYGDYGRPDLEPCSSTEIPSPPLQVGHTYQIQVGDAAGSTSAVILFQLQ